MGKITAAEISELKDALKELQRLQTELGHSTSAASHMQGVGMTSMDFGAMIDNSGTHVSQYIDARTTAITTGLTTASSGVSNAISLLSSTITNYETNEKTHADAANATGTGGSGSAGRGMG